MLSKIDVLMKIEKQNKRRIKMSDKITPVKFEYIKMPRFASLASTHSAQKRTGAICGGEAESFCRSWKK